MMKDETRKWNWRDFTTMPEWREMKDRLVEMKMKEVAATLNAAGADDLAKIKYQKGRVDGVDATLNWMNLQEKMARDAARAAG